MLSKKLDPNTKLKQPFYTHEKAYEHETSFSLTALVIFDVLRTFPMLVRSVFFRSAKITSSGQEAKEMQRVEAEPR